MEALGLELVSLAVHILEAEGGNYIIHCSEQGKQSPPAPRPNVNLTVR